ncbi:TCP-1/cpn60 chaperonin family protein [Anaerosolibacter carboniphilus]|nr:TCP-1/cpn60 chaperonin family protein [Anaerosolibacter carboniphilus]
MKNADGENRKDRSTALDNNVQAIRAVVSAVEGTIGPKGMDCMIVDDQGQFIVTNDGVTILMEMDVSHPAALMMVNAAYAQQCQAGDGTTTMTIIAGAIIESAVYHIQRGVSVHKLIEGIKIGISEAIQYIEAVSVSIDEENQELLKSVAWIAGRGNQEIVDLIYQGAQMLQQDKIKAKDYRFGDHIIAIEGTQNEILQGMVIDRKPLNHRINYHLEKAKILIIDDCLQPEGLGEELLNTENGFGQYIENRKHFEKWIEKIIEMKVNAIFIDRRVDEYGEQALVDAGVMVVHSVLNEQLLELARFTGARPIKKNALNKDMNELENYCGYAGKIDFDPELEHIKIFEGIGDPMVKIIISASTGPVLREKERVAKDAASALQAATKYGIVTGGGAIELACAVHLEELRNRISGTGKYGIDCVIDGLKRPIHHMIENAGYNPLEKLEAAIQECRDNKNLHIGIDCESGEIKNLSIQGIFDPTWVKTTALKTACEIAEAILKINLIVKGKNM